MPRHVAFFKPFGVLSSFTHEDEAETKRTLSEFGLPRGVYAAGRLDFDSEGLLVLSDDGALINALTDPVHKLVKTYWAQVEGVPSEAALAKLRGGLELRIKGAPFRTQPCAARVLDTDQVGASLGDALDASRAGKPVTPHGPTAWIELQISEGKKRQVRHMTAAVGLPTLRLLRVAIGPVLLAGLAPGRWRDLSAQEVATIQQGRAPAARRHSRRSHHHEAPHLSQERQTHGRRGR